jgi:ABC-type antimicrobial peptide transport system permease subunit
MSFTVAQRSREIAIRSALGASSHRLVFSIVGRGLRIQASEALKTDG